MELSRSVNSSEDSPAKDGGTFSKSRQWVEFSELSKIKLIYESKKEIKVISICDLSNEQVSKESPVSAVAQFWGGYGPLALQLCQHRVSVKSWIVDILSTQLFKLTSMKSLCIESEAAEKESRGWLIQFESNEECLTFHQAFRDCKREAIVETRIDQDYFRYYGQLESQQHMLQDSIRTGTYRVAIDGNGKDFEDRVVLDVGAGSGVLSLFAAKYARKVYAVEASDAVKYARKMIEGNQPLGSRIEVIHDKIEDVFLPEKVDILISEPIGFLLVHERMIETYVKARDLFLKPDGQMFPDKGIIYVAPYNDENIYNEILGKANFWMLEELWDIDISPLHNNALDYYFSQPLLTTCKEDVVLAQPCSHTVDFKSVKVQDLHNLEIPFQFTFQEIPKDKKENSRDIQGLIFWFDVNFPGSGENVLTTKPGPRGQKTHWKQVVCLLRSPIAVMEEMEINGLIQMKVNEERSYTIKLSITESIAKVQRSTSQFKYQLQDHYRRDTSDEDEEPEEREESSEDELGRDDYDDLQDEIEEPKQSEEESEESDEDEQRRDDFDDLQDEPEESDEDVQGRDDHENQ